LYVATVASECFTWDACGKRPAARATSGGSAGPLLVRSVMNPTR